ncbi:hypothetical protein [Acetobacter senegalensis]|nr:hypothetical protein [Acetobacter senegalensis]
MTKDQRVPSHKPDRSGPIGGKRMVRLRQEELQKLTFFDIPIERG